MNTKKRINWVDGMLINKMHFKGMEDYLLSNIYTTSRILLSGKYGIINNYTKEPGYPYIRLSIDASDNGNQKIIAEQIEFRAISPAGTLLEITNDSFPNKGKFNSKDGSTIIVKVKEQKISHGDSLYLILLTQPFDTKGFGQSIDNKEPLRYSFCSPVSELKCVSCNSDKENIVGPNFFPIAKIKIINHRLEIDRNYIPPCFSVSAHHTLMVKCFALLEGLLNVTNNIDAFIQKNQNESDKYTSYLSHIYTLLYPKLIEITETLIEEKENIHPKEIIRSIKITAIQFKKILLCNSDSYTFFTEKWNSKYGINFNSFSKEIDNINKQKYYDIYDTLEGCQKLLDDYLIKITEIDNYNFAGYKAVPQEPNPDIIL